MYHNGGVKKKLQAKEMANIVDICMDRTEGMTEKKLNLLTHDRIPGKVSYAGMYFVASYYNLKNFAGCKNKQNLSQCCFHVWVKKETYVERGNKGKPQ